MGWVWHFFRAAPNCGHNRPGAGPVDLIGTAFAMPPGYPQHSGCGIGPAPRLHFRHRPA